VARRLDAEPGVDSEWHGISRLLLQQRRHRPVPQGRHIELQEFGDVHLLVDGVEVRPRIAKSYELLAHLVDCPGRAARRDDLMDALFDGRDDTSSRTYLRQAILHLREALPRADALDVDKHTVALHPEVVLSSQAQQFEILVAEAGRLIGEHQTNAIEAALALFDRGEFFRGRSSAWIDDKRDKLAALAATARMAAAETNLLAGVHGGARRHAEAAVRADPYRERGWQILMQVAAAVGDRDAVISAYRECRAALADVGLEPSAVTQALVDELRAAPR
jgi:DNA-binding SARP family transcriptional activator